MTKPKGKKHGRDEYKYPCNFLHKKPINIALTNSSGNIPLKTVQQNQYQCNMIYSIIYVTERQHSSTYY